MQKNTKNWYFFTFTSIFIIAVLLLYAEPANAATSSCPYCQVYTDAFLPPEFKSASLTTSSYTLPSDCPSGTCSLTQIGNGAGEPTSTVALEKAGSPAYADSAASSQSTVVADSTSNIAATKETEGETCFGMCSGSGPAYEACSTQCVVIIIIATTLIIGSVILLVKAMESKKGDTHKGDNSATLQSQLDQQSEKNQGDNSNK
jgi:hypothetical protein